MAAAPIAPDPGVATVGDVTLACVGPSATYATVVLRLVSMTDTSG